MSSSSPSTSIDVQLRSAVMMLAADNARLCSIAIAADKLATAVGKMTRTGSIHDAVLCAALDEYLIVRQGS